VADFHITVIAGGRQKTAGMHGRKTESLIWLCGNQSNTGTAWYIHESVCSRAVLFYYKNSCMREEKTVMEVIRTENLSKTFRVKKKEKGMKGSLQSIFHPNVEKIRAVAGISFTVNEGEILAFIGPNGAGKSTTIKMLTGILYPDGGKVEVLGIDPTKKRKELAYQIGTVFGQKEQLWTHLTPYDNFRFFGAIYDIPEEEIELRIRELTDIFELGELLNIPVRGLSLGQRIRCEMAASLIHKPKVLFLDEPTIGLDPVVKENIRTLIRQMNEELHTTVFLTSHDVGDIERLCKRIIIVNDGRIVLDDSMEHMKLSDMSLESTIMEIYKAQRRENTAL